MSTVSQAYKDRLSDESLDVKRQQMDPLADEVIRKLIAEKGKAGAMELFNLLIREIELPLEKLPAVVSEFARQTSQLPSWANQAELRKAERLFIDHGPKFMIFLFFKSLPMLYACGAGAEVLVNTGRLAHDENSSEIFSRRIAETGQFLLEAMAPNALIPGGKGITITQKVRLIHASIRQFIPAEHWDAATKGAVINQEYLAGTLMSFSVTLLEALEQFGIEETEDRQEAYLHAWKIIGYILGVDEDLLPRNIAEGHYLMKRVMERNIQKSEAGAVLAKALIEFGKKRMPLPQLKISPEIMIRFLNDDAIVEALSIPPVSGCLTMLLPHSLRSFYNLIERLEEHSKPLNVIIDLMSRVMVENMVHYFNVEKKRKFVIPKDLKEAWKL